MARRPDLASLTREGILSLSVDEALSVMERAGVRIDQQALFDAADAVYARAGYALRDGAEAIDEALVASLEKQVDRALTDVARRQLKSAVRDVRLAALEGADPTIGLRDKERLAEQAAARASPPLYVWIATMVNTCESCLRRHGDVRTMIDWQAQGLPGSAVLVCNGNCNCSLLPYSGVAGEDVYVDILGALDDAEVEVSIALRGGR